VTRSPTLPAADDGVDPARLDGLTRVALPVGVNAVDSVNMHVLADGDSVTLVDCGVCEWYATGDGPLEADGLLTPG
jgi:hypothetical protein